MFILAIIIGILLILFGGGCTLIVVGLGIADPKGLLSDLGWLMEVLIPFGILPLGIGILLVRWGVRQDRERRNRSIRKPDG